MGRIERKVVREEGKAEPGTMSSRELWKGLDRGKGTVRMWFWKDHPSLLSSANLADRQG